MKSRKQEQLPGPLCPPGPSPFLQAEQNFDLNVLNDYIMKDLEDLQPTQPCDFNDVHIGEIRNQLMDQVPSWACNITDLLPTSTGSPLLVARGTGSPQLVARGPGPTQMPPRGGLGPSQLVSRGPGAPQTGSRGAEVKHHGSGRGARSRAPLRPEPRCFPVLGPGGVAEDPAPKLVITEQPKQRGMRFRYECEGRSAGSIPGENTTEINKTLPTAQIQNWHGEVKMVISLVTKDAPYKPHPHSLVGKDCQNGICEVTVSPKCNMKACFANLGIQCVKKKETTRAVEHRLKIGIDPFNVGDSLNYLEDIDMNVVRLCFQAFIQDPYIALTPVLSDPIYDKKATNTSELRICRLNKDCGVCTGGEELFLLCDKVQKEDIAVVFSGDSWEARGVFSQTDVHRQIAIVFKTPPYCDIDIQQPVLVSLRLYRPSDKEYSDPFEFRYTPKDIDYYGIHQKWKRKIKFPPISTFIDANMTLPETATGPKKSNALSSGGE
ncbi:transcription factor RelB-like [Leucoraja erinacea]|uniref:transcription factor RelB-like n=1 Tax=Leucoraja erinaceus TaxID=7782 RepID=UPI0024559D5D|nr:transcription factor RelB-like [Leucoraja erinacea]